MADPLLELHGISKSFGSLRVIDDLSLAVEPGEALGVVGPNGAGKTTMMNLIVGTLPADGGRIVFEGQDVTRRPPYARCRAGMGRTHQIPMPFEHLTVFENVLVGTRFGRPGADRDHHEIAFEQLERTGLASKANVLAGSLTLLERKRLELARSLATAPRVLLLDEVAGGLIEAEVALLIDSLRDIRGEGIALVWIEHIVSALLSVVDRLLAMDFGRKLIEGEPRAVMGSREVQTIYLGVEEE